ncbi:MAG: glycosyltransferase family 9 protein [candidate division Zixibacteria bacterium]|nr:glycosyltransferase family 9 protein [candidate division Zixibacteria bacterium]
MNPQEERYPVDTLKAAEHRVKALFFALFRVLLKKGRSGQVPLDGRKMRKVLFLRPESKIGDLVISLPVFDALHRHFPGIRIAVMCSPRNVALIEEDPRFERIFLYRKNLWRDIREVLRIRREGFDCVLDLLCDDSVTSLFLSRFCSRGKPRIGVGKRKYARYYEFNRYNAVDESRHIIANTLHLLDAFGIDSQKETGYAPPFISGRSEAVAEDFFQRLAPPASDGSLIGINLSAGAPSRLWAREKQVALIERIGRHDPGARFVVITVPSDRERGRWLCERFPGRLALVPNHLSIVDVAAIIRKLDLLITPDTALVHVARAFEVPVVSMYPGVKKNTVLWRPYGQETGFVVARHYGNIFDITVEQAFGAFMEIRPAKRKVSG